MEFSFGIHYFPSAFPHWSDTQVVCEDVRRYLEALCRSIILVCKRHELGNGGKTQTYFGT